MTIAIHCPYGLNEKVVVRDNRYNNVVLVGIILHIKWNNKENSYQFNISVDEGFAIWAFTKDILGKVKPR